MATASEAHEQLRAEMRQAIAAAIAPLRQQLDQQDEWMNGLYLALLELLQATAKEQPAVIRRLLPAWEKVADRYEQMQRHPAANESPERLEPRKLLYRMLQTTGALRHLGD